MTGSADSAFASVSKTPASGTPQVAATGTTEQVRQLVQCGQTMYAVGSFTLIAQSGTTYARNNVFSFSAVAPYTVTSWNPNVNGVVNTIGFNGTNCSTAYIGGKFTSVRRSPASKIAPINTTPCAGETRVAPSANSPGETVASPPGNFAGGACFLSN